MIILVARKRAIIRKEKTYEKHLVEQMKQYTNLLISPCIIVLLAVPRLVISFLPGCMISARDPWLFLVGYIISFVPSILTFVVYIYYRPRFTEKNV